jgi:hypothetical protein
MNDASPLEDWIHPQPPSRSWGARVPQVDVDGNEIAGVRLPDIAVPRGTFTGWNLYKEPMPAGELADRDGTFLAFAATPAERAQSGDPRASLSERYATPDAYRAHVREVVVALRRDRLLLEEDAAAYLAPV